MTIPANFPVQPIAADDPNAEDIATCGVCGLFWDDGKPTSWTPAPSGRCPFEYFHEEIKRSSNVSKLRPGFRFFHEWAGYVVGQRAIGAMDLARAELRFQALESEDLARVVWEHDNDADTSWLDQEGFEKDLEQFRNGDMLAEWARIDVRIGGQWVTAASLSGIFGADDNYRRVVTAELAADAADWFEDAKRELANLERRMS